MSSSPTRTRAAASITRPPCGGRSGRSTSCSVRSACPGSRVPSCTSFPRRRLEVDFLSPLRFGDEVVVEIEAAAVGRTSVTYRWRVLRAGVSCVEGTTTCVHVDDAGRPSAVPGWLRAALVT
ncbi:acyl-CoA thioesterase [Promicromonospora soli]